MDEAGRPLRLSRGPRVRSGRHVARASQRVRPAPGPRPLDSAPRRRGTIPVRFPSTSDPGNAGWHIDGSYDVGGQWWVNVQSRGRGLLALFLFSDVGYQDAPTE